MAKPSMLTPTEAAEYLGIKLSYLYKLMMRRVIPYYKPGGKLCHFDPEDLAKWQRSVRVATDEEIESQAQAYILKNNIRP